MFAGNFAPLGWAFCDGSLWPISEYETLFNLIGTTYGGDGQSTFAMPDLRGRVPMHQGNGFVLAETGGVETVTLTVSQIPAHSHVPQASTAQGSAASPSNGLWAESLLNAYSTGSPTVAMNSAAIGSAGGSQPHDNLMPYVAVNFIISQFGIFPSQT